MQEHEIAFETGRGPKSFFGISYKKLVAIIAIVVCIGIYIGILLFGENSVTQYFKLQEQKQQYRQQVLSLQKENAKLQKEYFELKEVQPQE